MGWGERGNVELYPHQGREIKGNNSENSGMTTLFKIMEVTTRNT